MIAFTGPPRALDLFCCAGGVSVGVPGAPLGQGRHCLTMLCGTMFGLQTPDGRAELRRHRWFETSFSIPLRPACQHGHVAAESISVCGTGMGPGNSCAWFTDYPEEGSIRFLARPGDERRRAAALLNCLEAEVTAERLGPETGGAA